jgi:hypothetical protein
MRVGVSEPLGGGYIDGISREELRSRADSKRKQAPRMGLQEEGAGTNSAVLSARCKRLGWGVLTRLEMALGTMAARLQT